MTTKDSSGKTKYWGVMKKEEYKGPDYGRVNNKRGKRAMSRSSGYLPVV